MVFTNVSVNVFVVGHVFSHALQIPLLPVVPHQSDRHTCVLHPAPPPIGLCAHSLDADGWF